MEVESYTIDPSELKQKEILIEPIASEQQKIEPLVGNNFEKLDIENPAEFLAFFDDNINTQRTILHPWQVEEGEKFGSVKPTAQHPFKYVLCAANGSGKDAYVIAPFAMWFISCKIKSLVIITSSSGVQLTNQTEKYIALLAEKVNNWALKTWGKEIIKVRQRRITCLLSGSEILLFATDEKGKAEGYHPIEPWAEMAIIVNEAKSVSPDIIGALKRCTGYNYWLYVSTPGEPQGDFFQAWKNWPNKRRITVFDCPHQSMDEYETDKRELGEHDPLFRSKWLALFTYVDGKSVISQLSLERLLKNVKQNLVPWIKQDKQLAIGIDVALSTNGDESVITSFIGNKQQKLLTYRIKDATVLADKMDYDLLHIVGAKDRTQTLNIDDGGVGRAVADILRRKGWVNINRILNNSPAKNKKQFRNRGAELWYKFSKLIENQCIILLDDNILHKQIFSRKYKDSTASIDRLTLQSKREMISEGLPSPDRADGTVLALAHYNVSEYLDAIEHKESKESNELVTQQSLEEIARDMWNIGMGKFKKLHGKNSGKNFSVSSLIKSRHKVNNKLSKYE